MSISIETLSKELTSFATDYLRVFLGFLLTPRAIIRQRLDDPARLKRVKTSGPFGGIDEKAVVFAGISLLLGIILSKSFHIQDAPKDLTAETIAKTICPFLLLWVLYGGIIHSVIREFHGKGTLSETINAVLYTLGILHILMIVFVYLASAVDPQAFSYAFTLRDVHGYGGFFKQVGEHRYAIFGFNAYCVYYTTSTLLTAVYLGVALSETHKLPVMKIWLIYLVAFIAMGTLALLLVLASLFVRAEFPTLWRALHRNHLFVAFLT